jgi:uncharacterized protein involved in exopolysaccharide biosynthesis
MMRHWEIVLAFVVVLAILAIYAMLAVADYGDDE